MTSKADEAMAILRTELLASLTLTLPDPALAVSITELAMFKVTFSFAGQTLHFRKLDYSTNRNAHIRAERDAGRTVDDIAELVHLDPRHVRRILKQCA